MPRNHGPWTIKERVQKYKNPWMEVREDRVIRPDGRPGIFGTVRIKAGISVVPLDENGFVYLTSEFKYAVGRDEIEAVSGGIDNNEKPLSAAKRELKEELGIQAKEWVNLGLVNPFTSMVHSPAHLFLAKKLRFKKYDQEGTEKIKILKIEFDKAAKMVFESKITHGPSCVLILKAKEYLKK